MVIDFGRKTVNLEDCVIDRRNFGGGEVKRNGRVVNEAGKRNFLLILSPEATKEFADRDWNVGQFSPKEEGVKPEGFLRVNVSYWKNPPIIHYISGNIVTDIDETRLHILDNVDMENVDMRIVGVNKQTRDGVWKKYAYVEEMWITVTPDRFASKYANLRKSDATQSPVQDDECPFN